MSWEVLRSMSASGNAPSSTSWARPADLLQPASGASQTAAYEVTVDNLDAFLFAVLHTVPDCSSKLQFPGLKTRTVNSITYAFEAASDTKQPSVLVSKAKTSGNNFGKVIRNVALGLRVQHFPAVNSAESLKVLESMLLMVTSVYQGISELITDAHPVAWASAFLEGMRYQLKRMLSVLLEYLKNSKAPKRFWGYQKLSRKLMKQPDQEASQWKPTDEGVFNFLVLLVHGWHMVSRGQTPVPASTAGFKPIFAETSAPGQPTKPSQSLGRELPEIKVLLTDFFERGPEDVALLTLLLDTGRLRYASTPERETTQSPAPPQSLTYSPFGRKMLRYSLMGASIPASGSWLHGLQGSGDGATQHLSENANSEAVHSVDLGGKSSAWTTGALDESGQKSAPVDQELPSAAASCQNSGAPSSGLPSANSPDSATQSHTPSSARSGNWKSWLATPFSGAKRHNQNKMAGDQVPPTPFDNPDDSLVFKPGASSPSRQVDTAHFGYQNSANASSTISLPDPQGSQSIGLSTSRQLLSNVNPIASTSFGARSSTGGASQFQTFNQWLRPGADNSSGAASSNVASIPLACVAENEVAGEEVEGEASKLDSKYLSPNNEGTDSLTIDLGAAAAAGAARNTLDVPEESGPVFPSSPSPNPPKPSPNHHPKTEGNSTEGSSAVTRAEGLSASPRSPRSPQQVQRRGLIEAAFGPKHSEEVEARTSMQSRGLLTLDDPADIVSTKKTRSFNRSLSRSRSPSPGRFPTGSSQPRSSRIDRILGTQTNTPRSNIPNSPSRAQASIRTESSRSDTLMSPSKAQQPSAIPPSPQSSKKHSQSQKMVKSLPSDAFRAKCAEDVASRLRAMHTSPRGGLSTDSFNGTNRSTGTALRTTSPAPSPRQHSLSPRKARPALSPRGTNLQSPRYTGPSATSLSPRGASASARSGTRPSSGRSSSRVYSSTHTTTQAAHPASGKQSRQPPFAPPFTAPNIVTVSSGGNRGLSSNQDPSASYRTPGTDDNGPTSSKDPHVSTRASLNKDTRKGSSRELIKPRSKGRTSQGSDKAANTSLGKRGSHGSDKAASSARSVGDNESDDTSSRDIHSVRNPLRTRLRSTVSTSQGRTQPRRTTSKKSIDKQNVPDAALAEERRFSVLRREEPRSPKSPASPSVAAHTRATTASGQQRTSDSSGALSEAEARAWNDASMASRKLLVAPPGMSLAPASVALPDKSSLSSQKLETRGIRGPRTASSPKRTASRLWSSHASSGWDPAEEDDADSAVMHGILALGSTVGFMSDDCNSSALEDQNAKVSTAHRSSTAPKSAKLVSRKPLDYRKAKAAQLTAGLEVSVYETPPTSPAPKHPQKPKENESASGSAVNASDFVSAVSDAQSTGPGPSFGTPTSKLAPEPPEYTSGRRLSTASEHDLIPILDHSRESHLAHWVLQRNNVSVLSPPPTEIVPIEAQHLQPQDISNPEGLQLKTPPAQNQEEAALRDVHGEGEPWQAALDSMNEEECRGSAAVAGLSDVADKLQRDVAAETHSTHPHRVSALAGLEEVPTLAMLQDGKTIATTTSEAGEAVQETRSGFSALNTGLNSGLSGLNCSASEGENLPKELRMTRGIPSDAGDERSEPGGTSTAAPFDAADIDAATPLQRSHVQEGLNANSNSSYDRDSSMHVDRGMHPGGTTQQGTIQGGSTIGGSTIVTEGFIEEGVQQELTTTANDQDLRDSTIHESAGSNNVVSQNEPSVSCHNDSFKTHGDCNDSEGEEVVSAHPHAATSATATPLVEPASAKSNEVQVQAQPANMSDSCNDSLQQAPEATHCRSTEESVASHNPVVSANGAPPFQDDAAAHSSANGSTTAAEMRHTNVLKDRSGGTCQASATGEVVPAGSASGTGIEAPYETSQSMAGDTQLPGRTGHDQEDSRLADVAALQCDRVSRGQGSSEQAAVQSPGNTAPEFESQAQIESHGRMTGRAAAGSSVQTQDVTHCATPEYTEQEVTSKREAKDHTVASQPQEPSKEDVPVADMNVVGTLINADLPVIDLLSQAHM